MLFGSLDAHIDILIRIHNAYMLGSAWKIVVDTLYQLKDAGLTDESVVATLRKDDSLRSQYLVLYDLVNILVDLSQTKFSLLATTTRMAQISLYV